MIRHRRLIGPGCQGPLRRDSLSVLTDGHLGAGIAWYSRDQWSRLREIASDRDKLDDSYEQWLAGAQKTLVEMAAAGKPARRVDVDVDVLARWCQAEGRPIDSAARAAFAALLLRPADHGSDASTNLRPPG